MTTMLKPNFQELLEAAPDAMIVFDRSGKITCANALAEKIFGYGPGEMIGLSSSELMPLRFRERHEVHQAGFFAKPVRRPMGTGMELVALRRDGDEFPVEISLSPFETAEGLLAISAFRDVSERKLAEQKLTQMNRELQAALHLVKQLTGMLPICSFCKKIRDEHGKWNHLETYICTHSEAEFTHSVCPECGRQHYGDIFPV